MAFEKKEITLLERFEKFAASKSEAKRVYHLVARALDDDLSAFEHNSLSVFSAYKGFGEKALLLVAQVQIDILKG